MSGSSGSAISGSAASLSRPLQVEQAEVEPNQHRLESTKDVGVGSEIGLSAESLPTHPPLSASASSLKGRMMNHACVARLRRERFQSHVNLVSSSMIDMVHNFERQRKMMQETLRCLQPIHDNHARILQILSEMRETINKDF